MKKTKRKNAGFTLAETLLTVALLGIVFTALGTGIVMMRDVYTKITKKANAQTLLSTAVLEMSYDMHNASDICIVSAADNTVTSLYTSDRSSQFYYKNNGTSGIQVVQGDSLNTAVKNPETLDLVTSDTNTESLYTEIEDEKVTYNGKYFEFTILVKSKDGTVIESQVIDVSPYEEQAAVPASNS